MSLARAVSQLLTAFGAAAPDRVEVYLEAVREEGVCEACATAAARRLLREAKRRPAPAELLEAARSELATAAHAQHAPARPGLPRGGGEAWWETEGARIVRGLWPALSEEELAVVVTQLRRQEGHGLVERTRASIASAIGWEDERGPTPEREWFRRLLAWERARARSREGAA